VIRLIWIGPNRNNERGSSSKAYVIQRRQTNVLVQYGSVEVLGGGGGKYHWHRRPKKVVHRFRTKDRARLFAIRQRVAKERKGYLRLPGQVRIRRWRSV
jgi:predicted DNA-binding WGR domain protein